MQKIWIPSLGWENPLEKGMATHSSVLAWESHGQRSLVGYTQRASLWKLVCLSLRDDCTLNGIWLSTFLALGATQCNSHHNKSLRVKDQGTLTAAMALLPVVGWCPPCLWWSCAPKLATATPGIRSRPLISGNSCQWRHPPPSTQLTENIHYQAVSWCLILLTSVSEVTVAVLVKERPLCSLGPRI